MSAIIAILAFLALVKLLQIGLKLLIWVVIGCIVIGAFAGCTTTRTETVPVITVLPAPDVPNTLLKCRSEPSVGRLETQRDAARYVLDLREAGADCRGKLGTVGGILKSGNGNQAEIPPGSN